MCNNNKEKGYLSRGGIGRLEGETSEGLDIDVIIFQLKMYFKNKNRFLNPELSCKH